MNERMTEYLPGYYSDLYEARELVKAEARAIERLNADIDDVLAQFSIETATWGLSKWEALVDDQYAGLYDRTTFGTIETAKATFGNLERLSFDKLAIQYPQNIEQRRENIKAKIRGFGTVTKILIKTVAESYANGEVDVIEDNANHTLIIKFIGEYGVPAKISDIQETLRNIVPAHLAIVYAYTFVTYEQLKGKFTSYESAASSGKTYMDALNDR